MTALLIIVSLLVALPMLALRFGHDSRELDEPSGPFTGPLRII